MFYDMEKLIKLCKKGESVVRLGLDRYNINRKIIAKYAYYELDREQLKKLIFYVRNKKDYDEVKNKKEKYLQKVKKYIK